jgi:hypothetical protein
MVFCKCKKNYVNKGLNVFFHNVVFHLSQL